MAASLDEITQQVINLNSVIKELQVGAAEAKRVIEAQHARINLLQQPGGAGGQGREQGDHDRFQRRVDLKVLAPEPFTSKDEHRWREWAEEFEDYIEGIDSNLAAFMRSAPDEETPIDDSNLELVDKRNITDVWALLTKMLKHPEAKARQERFHRVLNDGTRAALCQSKLPYLFWSKASKFFLWCYRHFFELQRCEGRTPYETRYGKQFPRTKLAYPFGCQAIVHRKDNMLKFEPRCNEGILVGFIGEADAYEVLDLDHFINNKGKIKLRGMLK